MRAAAVIALALLGTAVLSGTAPVRAQEGDSAWSSRGELGLESRVFPDDDRSETVDQGLGLLGRLELGHERGRFTERARFYGRLDHFDRQRSVLVFEEAWAQVAGERLRLRAGLDIVNWTATEAFHPADVINARNLDSDLENLEKIGEPMVALQVRLFANTNLHLLYMPYRSEPIFASPRSRLGFAPGLDLRGTRQMLDRNGRLTSSDFGHQAALAIRQSWSGADLTLHALEHMDRTQPLIRLDPLTMRPFLLFQTVRQVGGTYQQAISALLFKVEGAYRRFVDPAGALPGLSVGGEEGQPHHGQVAVGLEYGLPHASGKESTLILEGQTLLGISGEQARAALTPFQRDVLVGYRFAFNDEAGRELMLGAIGDLERIGEGILTFSYGQRIGETWTVRAGLRLFHAERDAPGFLGVLRRADHVRLTLTRHF